MRLNLTKAMQIFGALAQLGTLTAQTLEQSGLKVPRPLRKAGAGLTQAVAALIAADPIADFWDRAQSVQARVVLTAYAEDGAVLEALEVTPAQRFAEDAIHDGLEEVAARFGFPTPQ